MKCQCKTQKGEQCKLKATANTNFCWKHKNCTNPIKKEILGEEKLEIEEMKVDLKEEIPEIKKAEVDLEEPFNVEELPKYVQQEVMLNMEYKDLKNMCKTNKKYQTVCSDQRFWKLKTMKDFHGYLIPISDDINWEKIYLIRKKREDILKKFNFSKEAYKQAKQEFKKSENYNLFTKYINNWNYHRVISRIKSLSDQTSNVNLYGTYKADYSGTVYPFILKLDKEKITYEGVFAWPEYDENQTIGRFGSDIKRIIYLSDSIFYEDWTELDEYFTLQIPMAGKLQPYYYYYSPKNIFNRADDFIFNDESVSGYTEYDKDDELYDSFHIYYKGIFDKQPEYILFGNKEYQYYPNNLNNEAIKEMLDKYMSGDIIIQDEYEGSEFIGNYLGTPFVLYFGDDDENLYIKIASSNIKPLMKELYRVFSNMNYIPKVNNKKHKKLKL